MNHEILLDHDEESHEKHDHNEKYRRLELKKLNYFLDNKEKINENIKIRGHLLDCNRKMYYDRKKDTFNIFNARFYSLTDFEDLLREIDGVNKTVEEIYI